MKRFSRQQCPLILALLVGGVWRAALCNEGRQVAEYTLEPEP